MTVELGPISAGSASAVPGLSPRQNCAENQAGSGAPSTGDHPAQILAERWPMLVRAMSRYHENVAEEFTQKAYGAIQSGVIRLEDRRQLAGIAAELGIRDFDAQLLIACAVRQWSLDRRYDPTPRRDAPRLSFEYRSWSKAWWRVGIIMGAALGIDMVIVIKWLS